MFRFFTIVFCLFSIPYLTAQTQSKIDSLTERAKLMDNTPKKLLLYENICDYYLEETTDLSQAQKYSDSLFSLATKLSDKNALAKVKLYAGMIKQFEGSYADAAENLQAYIAFAKAEGDSAQVARGLQQLSMVNVYSGNFDKSLSILYRALAILEQTNDSERKASVLNTIGIVYKNSNRFKEAIPPYKEASKIFKANKQQVDYGMCLTNMANVYLELKSYDSAQVSYEKALAIFYDFKNPMFIGTVLGNLGNLHEAKSEYEIALQYHQKALTIWRADTKKRQLANALNNLGKTYLKLKKYSAASQHLNEAETIGKEINSKPLLLETYSTMNLLAYEKKDYARAYNFLSLSTQLKDSIFNEKNSKHINELQAKFDAEKKDKQIVLLAKEKEIQIKENARQNTLSKAFAGGLIAMVLVAILVVYIFRQRMLLNKKINEAKDSDFKQQVTELEMKALRAQINPHFLFNCLNAINLMIQKGDSENATLYLAKFSKLVRLILENAEAASVPLENEIALLESYIQLEALRMPGKIKYTISIDKSIGVKNTYLPSMVLQPFVENAIWHGLVHKNDNENGRITIDIRQLNDRLLCTLEDNGVGRDKARQLRDKSLLENKSMGIKITEDRLRLLSGEQAANVIEIIDLKDNLDNAIGTRVIIYIPITEQ